MTAIFVFFIIVYKQKFYRYLEKFGFRYSKNSIKSLLKRKVYTEEGEYVGKIEDVLLKENKIESLKIKISRKKGIIIGYKHVVGAGNIVLVKSRILETFLNRA